MATSHKDYSEDVCTCQGLTAKLQGCKNKCKPNVKYCHKHAQQYKLTPPKECPICFEPFTTDERPTKCGHWMHANCLSTWLKTNDSCPMCREKLYEKEQHIDYINLILNDGVTWDHILNNLMNVLSTIEK